MSEASRGDTDVEGKPRILGVDDSLTIRRALEIVLKPAGYELELATDGTQAIDKAKAVKPALILLDFILPDMRGTDVCRRLAADPDTAHIPIVLISSKGAEIRQAYRDVSNVVTYITKPFKPQDVTNTVAEVLAKVTEGKLVKLTAPTIEGEAAPTSEPIAATSEQPGPMGPDFVREMVEMQATGNGAVQVQKAQRAALDGHDEADDTDVDEAEEVAEVERGLSATERRELLEWMFETLRASLEGVYVEEVDTPAGAAADQAKTYTDLIEQLSGELDETLRHTCSDARFTLYRDGSLRSLDETLLDVFRRACRLLFRAVVAGAVTGESAPNPQRILVACHHGSRIHEQLMSLLARHSDWQVFLISSEFRQLPMVVRLYGPTFLLAEVTGSGALWDQLRLVQRMPEARAMTVLGIAEPERLAGLDDGDGSAPLLAERGVTRVWHSAFDIERELCASAATDGPAPTAMPVLNELAEAL
jgi:CheY-like chemotaxis protein